jgi:hypothetical protein
MGPICAHLIQRSKTSKSGDAQDGIPVNGLVLFGVTAATVCLTVPTTYGVFAGDLRFAEVVWPTSPARRRRGRRPHRGLECERTRCGSDDDLFVAVGTDVEIQHVQGCDSQASPALNINLDRTGNGL